MSKSGRPLSDEDQALATYIAAMFGNEPMAAPAPKATEAARVVEAEAEAVKLANVAKLLAEAAELPAAPVHVEPVPAPTPPAPVMAPAPVPLVDESEEMVLVVPPERAVALIPEWGEKRFQTLFFRVGPLTLAVPLSQLGGIHSIADNLTPLFGKPKWFMGLQPYQEGNMQLVDTARWVMPEKYAAAAADGLDYQFVILLANTPWALACSQVHDAVTLAHEDVRWRTSIGKRPWLAGVVVEKMCALLDVENFIYLLEHNSAGALQAAL